jgi:hypothetical protein
MPWIQYLRSASSRRRKLRPGWIRGRRQVQPNLPLHLLRRLSRQVARHHFTRLRSTGTHREQVAWRTSTECRDILTLPYSWYLGHFIAYDSMRILYSSNATSTITYNHPGRAGIWDDAICFLYPLTQAEYAMCLLSPFQKRKFAGLLKWIC